MSAAKIKVHMLLLIYVHAALHCHCASCGILCNIHSVFCKGSISQCYHPDLK